MQQQQQQRHRQQKQAATAAAAAVTAAAAAEAPVSEASSNSSSSSSNRRKAGVRPDDNTRGCEGQASLFRATAKPIHAKTELKHRERGTQHCNNGRPTPVCDPCLLNREDSLVSTHSSSMKGPRLNFDAERQLAGHPKTTFSFCKVEF